MQWNPVHRTSGNAKPSGNVKPYTQDKVNIRYTKSTNDPFNGYPVYESFCPVFGITVCGHPVHVKFCSIYELLVYESSGMPNMLLKVPYTGRLVYEVLPYINFPSHY